MTRFRGTRPGLVSRGSGRKTAFQSKMLRHHVRSYAQRAALSGLLGKRMTKTQAKTYLRLERKIAQQRRDNHGRFA